MATDDLDRRIRKIVAEGFRSVATDTHYGIHARLEAVADALDPPEPTMLPCPFCGAKPEDIEGGRLRCRTEDCGNQWQFFSIEQWNRRVEVPHG